MPPREPGRPTICPAAPLIAARPAAPLIAARPVAAKADKAPRPPRRSGGWVVRGVGLMAIGILIGVGVAYVARPHLPPSTAGAQAPQQPVVPYQVTTDSEPDATVLQAPVDVTEARFASEATCDIAIAGMNSGESLQLIQGFERAHDQAALFEPGVVPEDVNDALAVAYDAVVAPRYVGGARAGAEETMRVSAKILDACNAWSLRIVAVG